MKNFIHLATAAFLLVLIYCVSLPASILSEIVSSPPKEDEGQPPASHA